VICRSASEADFHMALNDVVQMLESLTPIQLCHLIRVERIPLLTRYDIFLPCGITLKFSQIQNIDEADSLAYTLHNFKMDIEQVAFTGTE
jgi:hypothetical protein